MRRAPIARQIERREASSRLMADAHLDRWTVVGSCRRAGAGLRIRIRAGPSAGLYTVLSNDVPHLLLDGDPVALWRVDMGMTPVQVGTVGWSESGYMLHVDVDRTASRFLVGGRDIVERYFADDPREVRVVLKPGVPV